MTRGNILLVDDGPMVRKTIAGLLEAIGFDVVATDTADAALAELGQGDFDILLCDDDLGAGLSGTELITSSTASLPETVVLMSGNPKPDGLARSIRYLSKPFTITQLETALRPADTAPDAQGRL